MCGGVEQVYVCVNGTVYVWRGGAGVCMCAWDSVCMERWSRCMYVCMGQCMHGEVEQVYVCVNGTVYAWRGGAGGCLCAWREVGEGCVNGTVHAWREMGGGGGCIVCMCAWGDIHVCMRQCVCIEMGEGGRMRVCM